ncbi:MAG: histidine kinase [Gemmatimonadaceae bacterium]|nr:histidine kinase [Gemmatimonadaceae bacterium]
MSSLSGVARLRWALGYVSAWTPLLLVYAVLIGAVNEMPVTQAVVGAAKTTSVAAGLGLLAVWWTQRLGLSGGRPWRLATAHIAGALAYTALWNGFVLWDIRGNATWADAWQAVRPWFGWQVFFGVVLYGAVAAVVVGVLGAAAARDRERALQEADALRARAELAALRGRLDPHFLFNTLHTVGALVRRDPAAAERGLELLAELLRYVLDHTGGGRDDVPLEDELGFVDAYLSLEAMRLGDRLRVVRDVAADLDDVVIPSLSLQPLVENAIRHGLSPVPQGGTLTVRARRDAGDVLLTVEDDGAGAPPDASPRGYGLGIDSLRRRLAARYGNRASVDVTTAVGQGFRVLVRIPEP